MTRFVAVLAMILGLSAPLTAKALATTDDASVTVGPGSDVDEAAPVVKKQKKVKKKSPVVETPPAEDAAKPPGDAVKPEEPPKTDDQGGLNFDLNVGPKTDENVTVTAPVDTSKIRVRRTMLILHQTVGIVLTAAMIGSVITGQLSYSDKFAGPNSGQYELAHQIFVWPTEGLAALTAGLAIFAPVPIAKESDGFDRMTLHKIGEFAAFAGWAAELVLGIYTTSREGYANQVTFATAHLAVGYLSLGGMLLGLGAIVF